VTRRKYSIEQCKQAIRHVSARADDDLRAACDQAISDLTFLQNHRDWLLAGKQIYSHPAIRATLQEFDVDREKIRFEPPENV
jgi:hypothetical protein